MNFTPGSAQNWCLDPFGPHEARWFSDGIPTALVRDGGCEAHDPPPDRRGPPLGSRLPDPPPLGPGRAGTTAAAGTVAGPSLRRHDGR